MKKLDLSIFLTLLLFGSMFGQNQNNQWRFGDFAGINFNTSPPTEVVNSAINTTEGCASIADNATGNLLFYSNSVTIWNANNVPMPNGTGLFGDPSLSSTTAVVIIPKPNSTTLYYVVTINQTTPNLGIHYSVVDMTLNGGLGDVVAGQKNIFLYAVDTEKMAAVPSGDGLGYWLITHDNPGNSFISIKLDQSGFSATPVISSTGIIQTFAPNHFKINRQLNKLAMGEYFSRKVELFDFNNCTGVFSNPIEWTNNSLPGFAPYGIEFSPDGTKLYLCTTLKVTQYDISSNNPTTIENSAFDVSTLNPGVVYFSLQLAPDNKIYVAGNPIAVINFPNVSGVACGFQPNIFNFPNTTTFAGLHNWVYKINNPVPVTTPNAIAFANICSGLPTLFSLQNTIGVVSVNWNFGDSASGANNTATGLNPSHFFLSSGNYTVTATINYFCRTEVVNTNVTIQSVQSIAVAPISLCQGAVGPVLPTTIPATSITGTWSPAVINTSNAGSFNYFFTANPGQCVTPQTITLNVTIQPNQSPQFTIPNSFCLGSNPPILPTSSNNGIVGTWVPNVVDAATGGTYIFTPTNSPCATDFTLTTTIIVPPSTSITQGCDGFNYLAQVAYVSNGDSYSWINNSNIVIGTNESQIIPSSGAYTLIVTNNGCSSSILFTVANVDCGKEIPKGLSPNDDGANDTFDLTAFDVNRLEIFNRYGVEVYAAANYKNEWNGKSNNGNELPSGTYYYHVQFSDGIIKTGWVYLNR